MNRQLPRQIVLPDGRQPLRVADDTFERLAAGNVIVIPGALKETGLLDEITRLIIKEAGTLVDKPKSSALASQGVASMHQHLDGKTIETLWSQVTQRLSGTEPECVTRLLQKITPRITSCYVADKTWLRFFVPQDIYQQHQARFAKRIGHLRLQHPHRDSWFTNPSNALVLWAAISPVRHGNGMLIWPRMWGKDIDHHAFEARGHKINQRLQPGQPLSFALEPGDLLLFSGEHYHASELNRTDETRVVVSFRLTVGPPKYGEGARFVAYRSLARLNTGLSWLAGLRSRCTSTYLKYLWQRRLTYSVKRHLPFFASAYTTPTLQTKTTDTAPLPNTIQLPTLQADEIAPISEYYCVAQTATGPVLFERHCPHEGADLSCGHIQDGYLHCPAHNLRFDLTDGHQACASIEDLKIVPLRRLGDKGFTPKQESPTP